MKNLRIVGLAMLLLFPEMLYGQEKMISKEQLQEMFDSMTEQTDWDMLGEMVWGYFFTDSEKPVLEKVAPILEEMGYSVVSIYLSDKDSEDEADLWWLHSEKIEAHSVESLHRTNLEFYKFAEAHGLDSYDGMDVGPVSAND